jgi:hypothetical protein
MPSVELDEKVYTLAQRRATDAGYASVDEFVAEVLTAKINEDSHYDHLFTPERIAELERISAEIKAGGKTYTREELDAHFQKKRDEWQKKHAS